MSVNYKSLNECTKEYKFEKNQVANTIDLKIEMADDAECLKITEERLVNNP